MLVWEMSLHVDTTKDSRIVRAEVRSLRSPHKNSTRTRNVARLLDARRRHRYRWLAEERRDRHHGEHRTRAASCARDAARSGLLGCRRNWSRRHALTWILRGRLSHLQRFM